MFVHFSRSLTYPYSVLPHCQTGSCVNPILKITGECFVKSRSQTFAQCKRTLPELAPSRGIWKSMQPVACLWRGAPSVSFSMVEAFPLEAGSLCAKSLSLPQAAPKLCSGWKSSSGSLSTDTGRRFPAIFRYRFNHMVQLILLEFRSFGQTRGCQNN